MRRKKSEEKIKFIGSLHNSNQWIDWISLTGVCQVIVTFYRRKRSTFLIFHNEMPATLYSKKEFQAWGHIITNLHRECTSLLPFF